MTEQSYLSDLWGFPTRPAGGGVAAPLPQRQENGDLILGDGPVLRTRSGVAVRLPGSSADRLALVSLIDVWAATVLSERYRPSRTAESGAILRAYYLVRPVLPRMVQIWMRRWHARTRVRRSYLRWPFDGLFVALAETYLAIRLESSSGDGMVLRFWPQGFSAAAILTHDVEGLEGQARCERVAALETEYGFRSCFNFVAERYPLDHGLMAELRSRGFEIGVHGIKHDGKKFSSRETFEERLHALRRYQREWGADGFRSPATHRKWEWMPELPFKYDSSYPDTDPYEPIPGGCGSPWPFMLGSLVELPITLPQDHTLWEILRLSAGDIWRDKAIRLRDCQGLINIIVHPDYLSSASRWRDYEEFLAWLRARDGVWSALPREVAAWWTGRRELSQRVTLTVEGSAWHLRFH
jgi:peptidoglycan/xylan/chitin deacetylase (PgdA/CDA1 family)